MSCIGCKNFYYRSDGSGSCDMPYKDACLNNNFQFYQLSICEGDSGFSSKEAAERYFKNNILDIFLRENLEGTPPPPLF